MSYQHAKPAASPPGDNKQGSREVCIANISRPERTKRLIGGVIPFLIALAIQAWLMSIGADRLWRLLLFFLFVAAGSGVFQWLDKT